MKKIRVSASLLLLIVLSPFVPESSAEEGQTPAEINLLPFLESYFTAVREYDVGAIAELVSRKELESAIRSISVAASDEAIVWSSKLLFSLHAVNAAYCQFQIVSISASDDLVDVTILGRSRGSVSAGDVIQFKLVSEVNQFRLDSFQQLGENQETSPSIRPELDVCNVPISERNPAILLPGESIEDQAKRLGIPY